MDYTPFYFNKLYKKQTKSAKKPRWKIPEAFEEIQEENINEDNSSPSATPLLEEACIAPEEEHIPCDERTLEKPLPAQKHDKKKTKRHILTGLFIATIIVLCFAITIASAEFLSGESVAINIKNLFNEDLLASYYAVTTEEISNKNTAETRALSVIQLGGAGYIWSTENGYKIVISVYKEKDDAEAVKSKNDGTEIMEIKLTKTTSASYTALTENDRFLVETLDKLLDIAAGLNTGSLAIKEARSTINSLRNELLTKKDALYEEDIPTKLLDKAIMRTDCAFGTLDGICSQSNIASLSQEIRRAAVIIMASMIS